MKKIWNSNNMMIKVTNKNCGRTDIHHNVTEEDIVWIRSNPNLEIEVLEYNIRSRKRKKINNE